MRAPRHALPLTETCDGLRVEAGHATPCADVIANETAVALVYNGKPHVVMMATPQDLEDFVLGFSLSEGVIRTPEELQAVRIHDAPDGLVAEIDIDVARGHALERARRNLTGRVGCGLCGAQTLAQAVRHPSTVPSAVRMRGEFLQKALSVLPDRQPLYAATGAVHAAAWVDGAGRLGLVREDVGRHNALDKLIGALMREHGRIDPGAVLLTSRASHEMIQKAATVGIEIVCAVSAPTALAIRLAEETGLTLAAFARGGRHTVYTHAYRLDGRAGAGA